jgi:hypothetical protein
VALLNKKIVKEMFHFALIICYSYFHFFYLSPYIHEVTGSLLAGLGLWSVIVGIWGNLVGTRLVKVPLFVSNDYRKENYFYVSSGVVLIVVGLIFSV